MSLPINQSNIPTWPVRNGNEPPINEGARTLGPIACNCTALVQSFPFDGGLIQQRGQFSQCLAIFIDNSANTNSVQVTMNGTGQVIDIGPSSQGYFPVLMGPQLGFTAFSASTTQSFTIFLLNFDVVGVVWKTT